MTINEFMGYAARFARDFEEASLMWDIYREDPECWQERGFDRIQSEMLNRLYPQPPVKPEPHRVKV